LVIEEYLKCGFANCYFVEDFKNGQTSTPFEELLGELNEKSDNNKCLFDELDESTQKSVDHLLTLLNRDGICFKDCKIVLSPPPSPVPDGNLASSIGILSLASEEYSYLSCQSTQTQTDQEVQVDLDKNSHGLLPDEYFKMKFTLEFNEHVAKFGLQFTSLDDRDILNAWQQTKANPLKRQQCIDETAEYNNLLSIRSVVVNDKRDIQ